MPNLASSVVQTAPSDPSRAPRASSEVKGNEATGNSNGGACELLQLRRQRHGEPGEEPGLEFEPREALAMA